MVFLRELLVVVWVATATVLASPSTHTTCPIVTLDRGTFFGTTANGTNRFLGIPFAHPPSVLDFDLAHRPPLLTRQLSGLAICVSVGPSRLAPTLANTMLLRSAFRAPSRQLPCLLS